MFSFIALILMKNKFIYLSKTKNLSGVTIISTATQSEWESGFGGPCNDPNDHAGEYASAEITGH